tara:strand:- start:221 stop:547 length:327 start_codon:yes stop_codon:yes gene_type:complete
MEYTKKQKENIIKAVKEEAKLWSEASKHGAFKNLKSDIESDKQKNLKTILSLDSQIGFLRNEVKREQSNKKYWIDKYSELEQFIFDLLHSNDNLNIKYGSKFDEIRNK